MASGPPSEAIKPWERQSDETEKAFDAFDTYAKMGRDRSIAKAAEEVVNSSGVRGKDSSLLERWSSRHGWIARAAAWDRHVARAETKDHLLGRAEMRSRQIRQAQKLQSQVARRVDAMTDAEVSRLKPSEVVLMLRAAADIERKAREISLSEQDGEDWAETPTIVINFAPGCPPNFVAVRMASGAAGYIPAQRVDEFLVENPGSVAIR